MTKTRFRIAVILSMVWGLLGVTAALAGESRLPAALQEHLERQRSAEPTATDWGLLIVSLPLLAAYIASFIGMLRFSRWSRPMAVSASVVGLVGLPLFGPTVETGTATALHYLSSMFFGAAVALSYWSPAAMWFRGEPSPNRPLQPTSGGQAGVE